MDAKRSEARFNKLRRHYHKYHHADEDSDDEEGHLPSNLRGHDSAATLKDTALDAIVAL
jgi:thiamine phosphate synthase YjbQ (UPF0047 family)